MKDSKILRASDYFEARELSWNIGQYITDDDFDYFINLYDRFAYSIKSNSIDLMLFKDFFSFLRYDCHLNIKLEELSDLFNKIIPTILSSHIFDEYIDYSIVLYSEKKEDFGLSDIFYLFELINEKQQKYVVCKLLELEDLTEERNITLLMKNINFIKILENNFNCDEIFFKKLILNDSNFNFIKNSEYKEQNVFQDYCLSKIKEKSLTFSDLSMTLESFIKDFVLNDSDSACDKIDYILEIINFESIIDKFKNNNYKYKYTEIRPLENSYKNDMFIAKRISNFFIDKLNLKIDVTYDSSSLKYNDFNHESRKFIHSLGNNGNFDFDNISYFRSIFSYIIDNNLYIKNKKHISLSTEHKELLYLNFLS